MNVKKLTGVAVGAALAGVSGVASGGTDVYFNPLTQSSAVASPNHVNELSNPWQVPAGVTQENLTSLREVESDVTQSIGRALGAGRVASMFDMIAYDDTGNYLFIPHESPWSAGVTRYDIRNDIAELIFVGDGGGIACDNPEAGASCENWSGDYAAFDPARWTPNGTVIAGEEWSGEGRIIEIMNPYDAPADIQWRELESIANVAHEGINFSNMYPDTLYYIDEWRSGSLYKFVMTNVGEYTAGQTFVLSVNDFASSGGVAADYFSDASNENATRTGAATWVPLTDANGVPLSGITDPFRNGPTNDPRENSDTRGGRVAADDAGGTPYGRPEDMEVSTLANGNEVVFFTATSENKIYAVEITGTDTANVIEMVSEDTPKNVGYLPTSGKLNSPDNLALDANGNLYIIEDAPNSSDVGGDIWFVRDTNNDGVAESIDHFMSIQVDGSEATGMIFNPAKPNEFVVAVQHPDSTDLSEVPEGFGDAVWKFDISNVVAPRTAGMDNSGCDYTDANVNGGWGWNPSTGMSCPPADNSQPPADNCDYSAAAQNSGWGWDPVAGVSCPPR